MLTKIKADGASRLQEDKRTKERKKNILILIIRYLSDYGYVRSASLLEDEAGISLKKWDACDNVDLYYILKDYEEYHQIKFGKMIKLVKKIADDDSNSRLPSIPPKPPVSANRQKPPAPKEDAKVGNKETKKVTAKTPTDAAAKKGAEAAPSLSLVFFFSRLLMQEGQSITKKEEKKEPDHATEDFFDNNILKPMPDYSWNPELKELAGLVQREIIMRNPNVKFTDIVGLTDAKRLLKEAVMLPMKYPHFFKGLLEPWKGVLLFGPPGTGKTMLAKAVATECRTTFFNISASTIISKWMGESEKLVRMLFELARYHQPSTIFLDEIDSIMCQRTAEGQHEASRRVKTEILIQLDGLSKTDERVFLLAASNLPWDLDEALLRRLEKRVILVLIKTQQILVAIPNAEARTKMLQAFLPEENVEEKFPYEKYGAMLEVRICYQESIKQNYSGSDIRLVCKEAAMKPLRRLLDQIENTEDTEVEPSWEPVDPSSVPSPDPVSTKDFEDAVKTTKPTSSQHLGKYETWFKSLGSVQLLKIMSEYNAMLRK
eukprot:TRINITY_DN2080_c0_g1_i1.p1 TRINITY_DN2080_c0_g1~~TRINITY_DN2080_c0_g1_i1.p1  ORF type:complete len:545 (+),score=54.40 TRINITY_DN2080_c0_g1_i1:5990-7624(+)